MFWLLCLISWFYSFQALSLEAPVKTNVSDDTLRNWQNLYDKNKNIINDLLKKASLNAKQPVYVNSLIQEASPYLLRHAVNPINWYAWRDEIITKNGDKDKLIYLSIGYSTCHWCHVMEKESFVDIEVATFLNENYRSIKVDRELHPEIDHFFSDALTLIKGSAGWPINAILTPEGKIIWIDSYLPKSEFLTVLSKLNKTWLKQPDMINQIAENISRQVHLTSQINSQDQKWDSSLVDVQFQKWFERLDLVHGGFVGKQKFPSEAFLLLALERYLYTKDVQLAQYLQLHLNQLMNKGLRDHVFGGFFRYATDDSWSVPHFEKMLYNQAQLISVFSRASLVFANQSYLDVAIDTYEFTRQFLQHENQGFYSAIDADYKGTEGGYYLFTENELLQLTPSARLGYYWERVVGAGFFVTPKNAVLTNQNIGRNELIKVKSQLEVPHIDKKQITAWNALMVSGLIDLYDASSQHKYLNDASIVATFIQNNLYGPHEELSRASFNDQITGSATLEDFAYLASAYLALYERTFFEGWLDVSISSYQSALLMIENQSTGLKYSFKDSELTSPLSKLIDVAIKLNRYGKLTLSSLNSLKIKAKQFIMHDSSSTYSLFKVLSGNVTDLSSSKIIARGNGFIKLVQKKSTEYEFQMQLKSGWHINSNIPNQTSLVATKITLNNREVKADYPVPVTKKLGFDPQPLSLFTGQFIIYFNKSHNQPVTLQLQACSDKLCLLPEFITFN